MAEKYKHLFRFQMPTCEADAQGQCYDASLADEAIIELVAENKELENRVKELEAEVRRMRNA